MIEGLLGRKIGMTTIFASNGEAVPVTVLEVGPCVVTQIRTPERDGQLDRHGRKPPDPVGRRP